MTDDGGGEPWPTHGSAFVPVPWLMMPPVLADPISARILAALPRGSERFVEHLNRTGRVTTTEAIELLGVSRPTAIRHLQHLVDAGFLEAVRKSPNDPQGYWRTVVEGS